MAKSYNDIEYYENNIQVYIDDYLNMLNLDRSDLYEMSVNRWLGVLNHVSKYVFRPGANKRNNSNINLNDIDLLTDIYNIYKELCLAYDKPCNISGFCTLTSINRDTLNSWENNNTKAYIYYDKDNKLIEDINSYCVNNNINIKDIALYDIKKIKSNSHSDFVKNLKKDYENYLENMVQSGKGSTVGQLATLNYRYKWNTSTETINNGNMLTSSQDIANRIAQRNATMEKLELSDNLKQIEN